VSIQHRLSCLRVLYNYFDDPTKLFLDLYLAKFLNISAKPFFPCILDVRWN